MQSKTDNDNKPTNRVSRDAFALEDPGKAGAQPDRIVEASIVEAVGLWLRNPPAGEAKPGGNVWQRVKNIRRRDLFHLANFTEKPNSGYPPLSPEFLGLTTEDKSKLGEAIAKHNGMDYPQNGYMACCCCS